ncbi:MAG TPA: 3-keto-5-aminohexanoate cleavage protein [Thermoanaerobaculia bacterium]
MSRSLHGKFVLNVCLTGMVGRKRHNPHLPMTVEEITRDAEECIRLGASIVHVHARDDDEEPDWRPETYERIVRAIRAVSADVLVCVSTSGRKVTDVERRAACLDIDPRPDMASLTLGSLNFLREGVVNSPETVRALAARMAERGILPELEIFDLGMARAAARLVDEGVVRRPAYANILLGNVGTASTTPADLAAILGHLPHDLVRSLAGIGGEQLRANLLGLLYCHGVRVGLEDNLFLDAAKTPATNRQLVERVVRLAAELGLVPASGAEVRAALAL